MCVCMYRLPRKYYQLLSFKSCKHIEIEWGGLLFEDTHSEINSVAYPITNS